MERNLVFNGSGSKPDESLRLMLFDLDVSGHHPVYIEHLVKYWCEQKVSGTLHIVVSPKLFDLHADLVDRALSSNSDSLNFVAISPQEQAELLEKNSFASRLLMAFKEWDLLCTYAIALGINHCLLMYLDTFMLPLAFGYKSPCSLSGIYFRPICHYQKFMNFTPSLRERFWLWRDRFYQSKILQGRDDIKNLFCLDPFAVRYMEKSASDVNVVYLPDPVNISIEKPNECELTQLKESLNIEFGRQVFLLFGTISERKGIHQLLEAILMLEPDMCQKICLILVGRVVESDRVRMQNLLEKISQTLPVQIITETRFVTEREIQLYFQIADVVLAPYQRHVGMSGILVRAAAAQKPVLSSDYGLMGEITRLYELGLTVDSRFPKEIAQGITQMLRESPIKFGNPDKMKSFAQENAAERFAQVIFDHL